jgi:hypothetical protein
VDEVVGDVDAVERLVEARSRPRRRPAPPARRRDGLGPPGVGAHEVPLALRRGIRRGPRKPVAPVTRTLGILGERTSRLASRPWSYCAASTTRPGAAPEPSTTTSRVAAGDELTLAGERGGVAGACGCARGSCAASRRRSLAWSCLGPAMAAPIVLAPVALQGCCTPRRACGRARRRRRRAGHVPVDARDHRPRRRCRAPPGAQVVPALHGAGPRSGRAGAAPRRRARLRAGRHDDRLPVTGRRERELRHGHSVPAPASRWPPTSGTWRDPAAPPRIGGWTRRPGRTWPGSGEVSGLPVCSRAS